MSWTGELLDLLLFQEIAIDIICKQTKKNPMNVGKKLNAKK